MGWEVFRVGAGQRRPQAAAVNKAYARGGAVQPRIGVGPAICDPSRTRVKLFMVGVDVIILDVDQVVRTKKGLVGYDLRRALDPIGPTGVSGEATVPEPEGQLRTVVVGFVVVESREHVGLTELPIVKQVPGGLVVDAAAEFEARTICGRDRRLGRHSACTRRTLRQQLLLESGVVHIRPLGLDRPNILERQAGHLAGPHSRPFWWGGPGSSGGALVEFGWDLSTQNLLGRLARSPVSPID